MVGHWATIVHASSDAIEIVPAAMLSASIGSIPAVAHSRSSATRRRRQTALRGKLGPERLQLSSRRQFTVPQQPRRLLERRLCRQLRYVVAGDGQLAPFAVDVAQPGRCRNDSLEPAVDHKPT